MESFEQIAKQFEPMIHKIIHSLNIYTNRDEFYQIALIGLWNAYKHFDEKKGNFTSYAYLSIKGRCLIELDKAKKRNDRNIYLEEEYWDYIENPDTGNSIKFEFILSYAKNLTEKETKWLLASCLHDMSIREIAENENVSLSAVKQWRTSARRKIQEQMKE